MLGWRNKKVPSGTGSFQAPSGYRDSNRPIFANGEVVSNTYQVRKLLGATPSGQVFEAWDMALERLVALKAGWRDSDAPPLLLEARALAAVNDDVVVRVHGIGHHHGVEYVVMEGVIGMTLAEHIAEVWADAGRMTVDHALRILIAISDGLAAVHRAGLSHGDLRPDSVLYPGGGRVVFTGLGVTAHPRDASRPPSMAPELIQNRGGRGKADGQKVDLYMLGAIAVELVTGAPPFRGESLQETLDAHANQAVPDVCQLRPELPTELGDLILELMSKAPARRPSSAREVTEQLRVILERVQARPRHDVIRVLVVDEEASEVRGLWSRLRRAHARIEVDAARNATDAIAAIRRETPQLILFSMDLPGSMSGFELAMYLRGSGDARRSHMVALVDEINDRALQVLEQLGVTRALERGPTLGDQLAGAARELVDQLMHGRVPVAG